jgi:hypothetical protein
MANLFVLALLLSLVALPVGLIKPAVFQKIVKKLMGKDATRKNVLGSLASLALVSFIGIGVTAPTPVPESDVEVTSTEEVQAIEMEKPTLEETVESEAITSVSSESKVEEQVQTTQPAVSESATIVQPETTTTTQSSSEETYTVEEVQEPIYEEPEPTSWYTCSSNTYNCSSFSTHAEAQSVYDGCLAQVGYDVHGLEGNDNDGLACESLP